MPLAWPPHLGKSMEKSCFSFHHFPCKVGPRVTWLGPKVPCTQGARRIPRPFRGPYAPRPMLAYSILASPPLPIRKSDVLASFFSMQAVPIPRPAPARADLELRCVRPASTDGSRAGWPDSLTWSCFRAPMMASVPRKKQQEVQQDGQIPMHSPVDGAMMGSCVAYGGWIPSASSPPA